jgi:thioredoxin 1
MRSLPSSAPSASVEPATAPAPADVLVACLCADWCGSCRDYRSRFEQVRAAFPAARFVWVDIEDQADLVDPIEVESFPSILVAVDGRPRFFGTVLPHLETLERLIRSQTAHPGGTTLSDPEVLALTQRLAASGTAAA